MATDYSLLKIIYHHPRPITAHGVSGSQVRPYKMLEAFKNLGATVVEVTGDASTRLAIMTGIRKRISDGERFDFLYSENLTIPFPMSENHRLPLHPLLDHRFLKYCNDNGIPVSMFNRDVHWRDRSYSEKLPWWVRMFTIPLYWYDWWWHTKYLNTLYLPSEAMGTALPWMDRFTNVRYLPPGTEIASNSALPKSTGKLKLFYVGGIAPPTYDLRPLLTAILETRVSVSLTICCRKNEWDKVSHLYSPFITEKVNVLHRSGSELVPLYSESDLFTVVRSQGSYLDYSVPIKIYEAIGFGLPILCTPGGETARIVSSEGLGWVMSANEIADFLEELTQSPEMLQKKREDIKALQQQHTWTSRAAQVCDEMLDRSC